MALSRSSSMATKLSAKQRAARRRVLLWGALTALAWTCTYLIITSGWMLGPRGAAPAAAPLQAAPQQAAQQAPAPPARRLKEVFATLWALELRLSFNLTNEGLDPPRQAPYILEENLDTLKAQGVDILFTSFRWKDQEPAPSALDFRLQDYVQRAACSRGLRVAVVLDAQQTPPWVLERFPDAALVDARGGARRDVSFSHEGAMALAAAWGDAALERLAAVDAGCIHSIQPSFNNEYETKYTQERDCFQDYSPGALAAFRRYLAARNPDLAFWNARWGGDAPLAYHPFRPFASWDAVRPPPFFQHGPHTIDSALRTFYWDFQAFRHAALHAAYERACMRIAGRGFRCSLHFGEFMTSNDAIYAGGAVFSLAASPWVDYVIVDSNFLTAAGAPNDVRVVQLLLSAIKPFGKPVFFEGAFERIKDPATHRRAVALTVSSGTHGIGFTNWLGRVDAPTFFASVLGPAGVGPSAAMQRLPVEGGAPEAGVAASAAADAAAAAVARPAPAAGGRRALRHGSTAPGSHESGGVSDVRPVGGQGGAAGSGGPLAHRVAILAPHMSFLALKGLPVSDSGKHGTDTQQKALLACLNAAEATTPKGAARHLQVFAEPAMLLPRLTEFDRVWHLEPAVLLSGDLRAINAIRSRARLAGVPFDPCGGRGVAPLVVQECCDGEPAAFAPTVSK